MAYFDPSKALTRSSSAFCLVAMTRTVRTIRRSAFPIGWLSTPSRAWTVSSASLRSSAIAVLLCLLSVSPAAASHQPTLTKRHARAQGLKFVTPIVDLLDLDRTVTPKMVPPRDCKRVSRRTITCYFSAYIAADNRTVGGNLRIHLQRDGLLGFLLPFDPTKVWVERSS